MEYITSRGFELPTDQTEMENFDWFNMWSNRNFPYYELLVGDTLYWFDTTAQKLVWKTEVVKVDNAPTAVEHWTVTHRPLWNIDYNAPTALEH